MCESKVFLKKEDKEELLMENVAVVTPLGDGKFVLQGLLGDQMEASGIIEDINLMGHKIIIRQ